MLRSAIPTRFTIPWGKNAAGAFIRTPPVASQIGIQDGAASYNDGWPPDCFTPIASGGVPPFGQDFNGLENATTTWDIWYQAGAPIPYDATFSTNQGGYPQGAILDSAVVLGAQWFSTVDNNTTNPDDPLTSSGWARVGVPVGMPEDFLTSTMPPGWVLMNALTIGSAASSADFADGSALFLYVFNWTNFSNTQCPILTSVGVPTTRGANAVADFNANKRLTQPNAKGVNFIGADTMGGAASSFYSGVPVVSGNTTTPGSILGENLHTNTLAETPTGITSGVTQSITVAPSGFNIPKCNSGISSTLIQAQISPPSAIAIPFAAAGATFDNLVSMSGSNAINVTSNNTSGGAHNNVQRGMITFRGQKL